MRYHYKASTISIHGSTSRLGRRANTCPRMWFTATLPRILQRENQAVGRVCTPRAEHGGIPHVQPSPSKAGTPAAPRGSLTLHVFH